MQKLSTLTKIALLLFFLLTLMLGPGSPAAAAKDPQIVINEQVIQTDVPPMIINSRILVPIRVVSENLGAEVTWQDSTRTVHIRHEGKEIILQENNNSALAGFRAVNLEAPARLVNGRVMVPLRFVAEVLGAGVEWVPDTRSVVISTDGPVEKPVPEKPGEEKPAPSRTLSQIEYKASSNSSVAELTIAKGEKQVYTLVNPSRLVIDFKDAAMGPVQETIATPSCGLVRQIRVGAPEEGTVRVVFDLRQPVNYQVAEEEGRVKLQLQRKESSGQLSGATIVIDPGHGGWHPGTTGVSGRPEKEYVLTISLKLRDALAARGAYVVMTRSDDTYYDLEHRVVVSNQVKPDAFVSIHGNAHPDRNVTGVETFYYHAGSKNLAAGVQDAIISHTGQVDLGIKWRGLYVLRNNWYPGILVELGFMSNAAEERFMWLESTQELYVQAILVGLENYLAGK
jgi:N-acetylmuramoyl-L-alanine amidase